MKGEREIKKDRELQKMRNELREITRLKNSPEGKKQLLIKMMEQNQRFWSSRIFHHEQPLKEGKQHEQANQ
jgi:hypothetical protein